MKYFIKDISNDYFFRKKRFVYNKKDKIIKKLVCNNILFLDDFNLDRLLNDLRLVESLCGFKCNRLLINFRNMYAKNRYLYITVLLKFKINYIYSETFMEYIFFYELLISFLINTFNKIKLLNVLKYYNLNKNLLFINLKINYVFLSLHNKKRYKSLPMRRPFVPENFDNKLWIYLYWFFDRKYYSIIFFKFIENLKSRWINEKT